MSDPHRIMPLERETKLRIGVAGAAASFRLPLGFWDSWDFWNS